MSPLDCGGFTPFHRSTVSGSGRSRTSDSRDHGGLRFFDDPV